MEVRKTTLKLALGASCAMAVLAAASVGHAEERSFNLASAQATETIPEFARQAGIQIVAPADKLRGVKTPAIEGRYDSRQALAMLIDGTGLRIASDDGRTVTLVQDPQGGSAAGGGATVEALIVTAQKREEDIQDVPIAISAFTQEQLERSQVAGGPDLITQVPNMTFTKTNFSSYSIQIRGIGTQAVSATTDPGVAVAFNNTPFTHNRFFEQEFFDLQRVEVLRGPQGTLYGRNATAGVVNLISQKPRFIYEAKLSADVANYNSTRLEGMINIPLVEDAVALRLAGAWTKRDGYAFNEITGSPIDGRDLWSTRASLRFSPNDRLDINLIWEHFQEDDDRLRSGKQLCKKHVVTDVLGAAGSPLDAEGNPIGLDLIDIPLTQGSGGVERPIGMPNAGQNGIFATLQPTLSQGCIRESLYSADSFQTPNGASVPYYVPVSAIGVPISFFDPYANQAQSRDLRVVESTLDPKYQAESNVVELQASYELADGLTLASETAYSSDFVYSLQDFNRFNTVAGAWSTTDGSKGRNALAGRILDENGVFCDPQIGCSDRLIAMDLSTGDSRQFSQEFRLSSDFDGAFNFSLGANFLRFDTVNKYYVFINSLSIAAFMNNNINRTYTPSYPYIPGVSDNAEALRTGLRPGDVNSNAGYVNVYAEPNSISNIQDTGHNYFLSKNPYRLISYAVFGEAYYDITDTLKVTAGLRWTVDKKHFPRIPSWALSGDSVGYPVLEVLDQEWREPTGRLAVDWKPDLPFTDETLLYASYAHGYKAGGANPPPMIIVGPYQSVTRPKTFDAEFVDAFELGAKNTLADGRVTLNLAAFYYDYKDYQISEIVDRTAINRNFDATIWGLEVEADWRPLENLRLGFKGGYEHSGFADGEQAIDLMDRTAGTPGWVTVRPFPTRAVNCVLPTWLFAHIGPVRIFPDYPNLYGVGAAGGSAIGACEQAYLTFVDGQNVDPITGLPYVDLTDYEGAVPTGNVSTLQHWFPGTYPGWDPATAPNHGEGFFKDIGGNPLPNAPKFTATLTADYTLPLTGDWLATLHTDLYWQSQSNWRIFDDHEYNRIDEYFTMNLAAIFTNEPAGWKVMAYVKNVFDRDSITGAFLNSDDTGLTTNVFLTEPRLYGLRVTKNWSGGPLLGGFGERHEGPYPFTLEIGGQVQRQDAPYEPVRPGVSEPFSDALDPTGAQNRDLDWGDGRSVRLTYRPDALWAVSAGVRFGRTNNDVGRVHLEEFGDIGCNWAANNPKYVTNCIEGGISFTTAYNWLDASARDREEHLVADFSVGRDLGLGGLGGLKSTVGAALRYGGFKSETAMQMEGVPDWDLPDAGVNDINNKYPSSPSSFHQNEAHLTATREFKGVGPMLTWDATLPLLDEESLGRLGVDWSVAGGALFGKQTTSVSGEEEVRYWTGEYGGVVGPPRLATPVSTSQVSAERSRSVTVPVADLSLGLFYELDRVKVSAGYRWERYFDVLDVGDDEPRDADRTIDGPYFKLSVGFGG